MSANPLKRNAAAAPSAADEDRVAVGQRVAASYNARLAMEPVDKGIRWIYDANADSLKLVPISEYRRMAA